MAGAVEWADGLGNRFWQPVTGEDERLVRVSRYDFTWDAVWRGPDVFLPDWGRSNPVLYRRRKRAVRAARRREKQLLRARASEVREVV